jgi:hypothetical protein
MGERRAHRNPHGGRNSLRKRTFSRRNDLQERHMAEHEKEVIVTDGGGGGSGAIIAVVLLIAVLVVLFLFFGTNMLRNNGTDLKADVKIDTPATNN